MPVDTKFNFESLLPFLWAASLGLIDGIIPVGKFGSSVGMDTGDTQFDVWDVPPQGANKENALRYLDTFEPIYMACEDAGTTENVLIIGIILNASNQWELVPELCPLNGQSLVELQNQYIRIVRAFNANGDVFADDVWFSTESNASNWTTGAPDDMTTVQAHIAAGAQQTLMSHMTTPENYHTLMYSLNTGMVAAGVVTAANADVSLIFKNYGGVDLTKLPFQLANSGTSYIDEHFSIPKYIPPRTDIRMVINQVSRNSLAITASYDLLFFRKDRLPSELVSIIP